MAKARTGALRTANWEHRPDRNHIEMFDKLRNTKRALILIMKNIIGQQIKAEKMKPAPIITGLTQPTLFTGNPAKRGGKGNGS
jgi:hypothetical protein